MGRLAGLQRGADAIVDAYNKQQAILQKEADYQRAKSDRDELYNKMRTEKQDDQKAADEEFARGMELWQGGGTSQPPKLGMQRPTFTGLPGWNTTPEQSQEQPPTQQGLGGLPQNPREYEGYKAGMGLKTQQVEGKQDYTMAKSFFDLAKPHVGNNPELLRVFAEIAGINVPDDVWDSWQSPQKTEKPVPVQKATTEKKQRDYVLEAKLSENREEIRILKKELRELDDSISGMDAEDDYDEIQRINDIKESRTKEINALEKKNKELSKETTTEAEPESETDKYLKSIGLK